MHRFVYGFFSNLRNNKYTAKEQWLRLCSKINLQLTSNDNLTQRRRKSKFTRIIFIFASINEELFTFVCIELQKKNTYQIPECYIITLPDIYTQKRVQRHLINSQGDETQGKKRVDTEIENKKCLMKRLLCNKFYVYRALHRVVINVVLIFIETLFFSFFIK